MSNNNIILRGDWNVVSFYSKDTINYSKENNPNAKKALFDLINTFDLEDCKENENLMVAVIHGTRTAALSNRDWITSSYLLT